MASSLTIRVQTFIVGAPSLVVFAPSLMVKAYENIIGETEGINNV